MSDLQRYQQQLAAAVLQQPNELLDMLAQATPVGAETGAAVYAGNRQGALYAAMEAAFPVCHWVVGNDYFKQLVRSWLLLKPVISGDMNAIGEGFGQHVAELCLSRPELEKLGYLPDLAELEWCLQHSYYADAPEMFDTAAFAELGDEALDDVVLLLNTGVSVLCCEWSVSELRDAYLNGGVPTVSQCDQYWLIYRPLLQPEMHGIERSDAEFLLAVQQGQSFSDLLNWFPEGMSRLGEFIQRGIIGGWR